MKTRTSRIARFAIPAILGLSILTLPGCIHPPFHHGPRIIVHKHHNHQKHHKKVPHGHRRVPPGHAKKMLPRPR